MSEEDRITPDKILNDGSTWPTWGFLMISMFSKPAEWFPLNADGTPSRQGTPKRLQDIINEKRPTFQKVRPQVTIEMVANNVMTEDEAEVFIIHDICLRALR